MKKSVYIVTSLLVTMFLVACSGNEVEEETLDENNASAERNNEESIGDEVLEEVELLNEEEISNIIINAIITED